MDEDIQLDDMLAFYPSVYTPGFQTMITSKMEFSELASDPAERRPPGKGFKPFKHQKFTHRFLREYDDLLVLSQTGTGKSCEIIGYLEYTRREWEKAKMDKSSADPRNSHFKQVIVLVKGDTQKNEFRNQLICRCSDGRYEEAIGSNYKNEAVQKTAITNEVKKAGYRITTYTTFAHKLAREYPTEEDQVRMIEDYSDTIFVVDEAHNLVIDPSKDGEQTDKEETYHQLWNVFHLTKRTKRILATATPMINGGSDLGTLANLLLPMNGVVPEDLDLKTMTENDRRVFFPDLPEGMEPEDMDREDLGQFFVGQFPPGHRFTEDTLEDLEPRFRGRVGYIRASDTGALPVEMGEVQDDFVMNGVEYHSQLSVYTSEMSEHQSLGYITSCARSSNQLYAEQRQASNFVFPDGYWGNGITEEERSRNSRRRRQQNRVEEVEDIPEDGLIEVEVNEEEMEGIEKRAFRRYVRVEGDQFAPNDDFEENISTIERIRRLSCKYADIIEHEMDAEGNCFIYSEFVEGSGAIVLALCFEAMGFERYDENRSMFIGGGEEGGSNIKPVCAPASSSDRGSRRVRPDFRSHSQGAPMRYAILTPRASDAKLRSMMEAMNSYENRHGDYIKVFISSRVGRDGININNVKRIRLLGSEWNESAMYQARSRGLRATSHEDLIGEEQARLRAEGLDPATASVEVEMYNHAAIARGEGFDLRDIIKRAGNKRKDALEELEAQLGEDSIDLHMYRISEVKNIIIKRIMRILKKVAVGCWVHYGRNVRDTDVDGSAACDYEECRYSCADPQPTEVDYETYDVIYSDEIVEDLTAKIINLWRWKSVMKIEDFATLSTFQAYRRKYILMAMENLIRQRKRFLDRYGYPCYIREDDGTFYLSRSYPDERSPSAAMSYYSSDIIATEYKPLSVAVSILAGSKDRQLFTELAEATVNGKEWKSILSQLSIQGQVTLLEDSVIDRVEDSSTPFSEAVLKRYDRSLFLVREPTAELNKARQQIGQRRNKRGRKPKLNVKRRVKKLNPSTIDNIEQEYDEDAEDVYLHTLYTLGENQTAYSATAKFNKGEGRTRLFKPSEREVGWRDLSELEIPIYNVLVQREIAQKNRNFEEKEVYGFVLPGDRFRIRDVSTQDPKAKSDARRIKRGKICDTWAESDLFDIMWKIDMPPPSSTRSKKTREACITYLLTTNVTHTEDEMEEWEKDKLDYYVKWYRSGVDKTTLCKQIRDYMAETDRLQE